MSESKLLTVQDILDAQDITIERVEVPEWGGHVFVRAMSGIQKERYVKSLRRIVGKGEEATTEFIVEKSSAKLAALTICDEAGKRLFTQEQVDQLSAKSAKALQRIVDAASKLNGLDKNAVEAAKNDSGSQEASDDSNID